MTAREPLREWLARAPFHLAMSSGFFGFYAHAGVLLALDDAGLAPASCSGSSAGALVTGAYAAGVSPSELAGSLVALRREEFWDPAPGAGLLRGALMRAKLEALVPERALERARVPIAISTYDVRSRRTYVMREGDVAAAICASCAVPVMFHPVRVGERTLVDGGIADRPGLAGAPRGRVLAHHLASRSPWRRRAPSAPRREDMVAVIAADLPRLGPFRLREGARAIEIGRAAMRAALARPVAPELLIERASARAS